MTTIFELGTTCRRGPLAERQLIFGRIYSVVHVAFVLRRRRRPWKFMDIASSGADKLELTRHWGARGEVMDRRWRLIFPGEIGRENGRRISTSRGIQQCTCDILHVPPSWPGRAAVFRWHRSPVIDFYHVCLLLVSAKAKKLLSGTWYPHACFTFPPVNASAAAPAERNQI